jgi:uncharacterized RDD family membrane protein YckC
MRGNKLPDTAGLGIRLKAFAFDYLMIGIYAFLLFGIGSSIYFTQPELPAFTPVFGGIVAFLSLVLTVMLYFAFQESSKFQATWGKRKTGLKVVTTSGEKPGFGQAFLRAFVKFLPWQMAHTALFHTPGWPLNPQSPPLWVWITFGLVWVLTFWYIFAIALTKTKRAPYERLSQTRVVNIKRDES